MPIEYRIFRFVLKSEFRFFFSFVYLVGWLTVHSPLGREFATYRSFNPFIINFIEKQEVENELKAGEQ